MIAILELFGGLQLPTFGLVGGVRAARLAGHEVAYVSVGLTSISGT
jgi:hypothetical protein